MGTRGFTTFVANGVEKTQYNQFDSYPEGLGATVLAWLRDEVHPENPTNHTRLWRAVYDMRAIVAGEGLVKATPVTPADIARFAPWTDPSVDTHDENNQRREVPSWYQLLRRTQGEPAEILAAGAILHNADFPRDSLFAEWGYVVDLDDGDFEVYRGYQAEPHDVGRFADRKPINDESNFAYRTQVWYPCKRIAAWPLDELPTDTEFLAATLRGENE